MNKDALLHMPRLMATAKMRKVAIENAPALKRWEEGNRHFDSIEDRPYRVFMRCSISNDILQVALFYPSYLVAGAKSPTYVVFVDRANQEFITYGTERQNWLTSKLDRLEWPKYIGVYPKAYASRHDEDLIRKYLDADTKKAGYDVLLQYQENLRNEEAAARYKRLVAPWNADMALTPPLPKDWRHWVDKVGICDNYIFSHYKKGGAKEGYCTYCGKQVKLSKQPYHNKTGHWPRCGKEVQFKAIGRIGEFSTSTAKIYLMQARPDGLILREFEAGRTYDRTTWLHPKVEWLEIRRTIFDRSFQDRDYYWQNFKNREIRWAPEEPPCYYGYYYWSSRSRYGGQGMVYGKTLPFLKKTELRHTDLVEWISQQKMLCGPDEYFFRLSKVPPIERIKKANLPRLYAECWESPRTASNYLKEPLAGSLTKSLGIDKQRLCRLRQADGGLALLSWLQYEKEQNTQFPDSALTWLASNEITKQTMDFILNKMSPTQIYNYLKRQMDESQESAKEVITTWKDYLSMAQSFGMNTDDEIIYRASKLRLRHNQLILRSKMASCGKQAAVMAAKHPTVNKICKSLTKYAFEGDTYAIVAPRNVEDIFIDGYVLNHCLFRSELYWDRIENHETYILFLRRRTEPDIPYYTLEVEPNGTVRQARTEYDRQDKQFEKIKQFLKEWQMVLSKRLSKKDLQRAKKSKVLRVQELEQMRTDNVLIRVGDLAGERLADVLMRDLMEVA